MFHLDLCFHFCAWSFTPVTITPWRAFGNFCFVLVIFVLVWCCFSLHDHSVPRGFLADFFTVSCPADDSTDWCVWLSIYSESNVTEDSPPHRLLITFPAAPTSEMMVVVLFTSKTRKWRVSKFNCWGYSVTGRADAKSQVSVPTASLRSSHHSSRWRRDQLWAWKE